MSNNTIAIDQFEAEYKTRYIGGAEDWSPCTVVGIQHDPNRFVILIEDPDGSMWVSDAECVRRT